jgi:predicted Zn finger-like uncharacterized protein
MYTRCPGCHTVHPVNALLLARELGKYRCGKCEQINNALESLFDEWPDPGDQPPATGRLPVLGIKLDLTAAKKSRLRPGETSNFTDEGDDINQGVWPGKKKLRTAWISTAFVLLIVVTAYLADFFQWHLLDSSRVENGPVDMGVGKSSYMPLSPGLDQIQILNRDMRSHPTRPDALRLSLTIVHHAPNARAFPTLEVILLDSGGQALTSQLFEPDEYLEESADIETGMTPEAYLHIKLNLADPGRKAVGFELHFR